jgi:hypothetical protein
VNAFSESAAESGAAITSLGPEVTVWSRVHRDSHWMCNISKFVFV